MTFCKEPPAMGGWRHWVLYAALLLLAIGATFHEAIAYPLLRDWDDTTFVLQNPHIALSWQNLWFYLAHPFQELYTPLPMWSLMVDHACFGQHPVGYHLHNLLLHWLASLALLGLLRRCGVRGLAALLAAMLWALHPQRVESVVWISERKDVLCGFFAMTACWLYFEERPGWCAWATLLAVLAKPAAIFLPAIYVLFAWAKRMAWNRKVLLPAMAGVAAALFSMLMTSRTNSGGLEKEWLVPLHNLFWYPLTTLVPFQTNPIYPECIQLDQSMILQCVGGAALLLGAVGAARCLKCAWRSILAACLAILAAMAPVLGLLHYTNFRYCDRYNYLVSATVLGTLALLLERLFAKWPSPRLRRACGLAGGLAIGLNAALSFLYVPYWENDVKLAYYALHQNGTPNLKAYELGIMAAFRYEAWEFLDYICEELPRRPPAMRPENDALVHNLLLFVQEHRCVAEGRFAQAETHSRQIVESAERHGGWIALPEPLIRWLYEDLARCAEQRGDLDEALFYRRQLNGG